MTTHAVPDEAAVNMHLLPAGMRQLVQVLGFTAAMRLVQRRGGLPLRVPKRVRWDSPDERVLALLDDLGSAEALARLVEWAGGGTIDYLPKYDAIARQLRHEQVRFLHRKGYKTDEIARRTQYSQRRVFDILGIDSPDRAAQRDLFSGDVDVEDAPDTALQHTARPGSAHNPFGLLSLSAGETDAGAWSDDESYPV